VLIFIPQSSEYPSAFFTVFINDEEVKIINTYGKMKKKEMN